MMPLLLSQYLVLHAHVIELRLQHVDAQLTRNIGPGSPVPMNLATP